MFEYYDPKELEAKNQTTMEYLEELQGGAPVLDESEIKWMLEGAAQKGHIEIIKCLTQHCKELNKITKGLEYDFKELSGPALYESAGNGQFEIMKHLVEQGADVTAHDNTPVLVASSNGHKESAVFLVKNGADPKEAMRVATEDVKEALADQMRETIADKFKKFSLPKMKNISNARTV